MKACHDSIQHNEHGKYSVVERQAYCQQASTLVIN